MLGLAPLEGRQLSGTTCSMPSYEQLRHCAVGWQGLIASRPWGELGMVHSVWRATPAGQHNEACTWGSRMLLFTMCMEWWPNHLHG